MKGTKSGPKSTKADIDAFIAENLDLKALSKLLDLDISSDLGRIRIYLGTKSGTKSEPKSQPKSQPKSEPNLIQIIDLLANSTKTRAEIFEGVGLYNKTGNFNNHIKPLIEVGIIELTIPDKPNSRFQKYRLTEKGKKLVKR